MSNLCCCEYIDETGETNHILACCCNCQHLDLCFERLITCRKVPVKTLTKLMVTANDRLRIPWKGGAKKFSKDAVLPVVVLPASLLWAAQGWLTSAIVFPFLPLFLLYAYHLYTKFYPQTHFFLVWNVVSTLVIFFIFEAVGVLLLEIRTDENLVFVLISTAVLFCLFKVKQKEKLSAVISDDLESLNSKVCLECNIRPPPRAYHCFICQTCILKRDQHCMWLNCCIGQYNHFWYIMFLLSNFSMLILCSNLILTTACHPFRVVGSIMLPDDCSDVYFDYLYAICFVTAIYSIESAVFVGAVLVHECWLISLGITGQEFRNRSKRKWCCGIFMPRPFSKGFIRNWFLFWRGADISYTTHKI